MPLYIYISQVATTRHSGIVVCYWERKYGYSILLRIFSVAMVLMYILNYKTLGCRAINETMWTSFYPSIAKQTLIAILVSNITTFPENPFMPRCGIGSFQTFYKMIATIFINFSHIRSFIAENITFADGLYYERALYRFFVGNFLRICIGIECKLLCIPIWHQYKSYSHTIHH